MTSEIIDSPQEFIGCEHVCRLRAEVLAWQKQLAEACEVDKRLQDENDRLRLENKCMSEALQAVRDWYDRDGSVGGLDIVMEEHVEPLTVLTGV